MFAVYDRHDKGEALYKPDPEPALPALGGCFGVFEFSFPPPIAATLEELALGNQ
jgi:hypothetical protein